MRSIENEPSIDCFLRKRASSCELSRGCIEARVGERQVRHGQCHDEADASCSGAASYRGLDDARPSAGRSIRRPTLRKADYLMTMLPSSSLSSLARAPSELVPVLTKVIG